MKLPAFNSYSGGDLSGTFQITAKLDGVCALINKEEESVTSKRGKPLYNFQDVLKDERVLTGCYEVFKDDWETTVSLVRTMDGSKGLVEYEHLNLIYPVVDRSLVIDELTDPTAKDINRIFYESQELKYEGLVLWPKYGTRSLKPIKVKEKITIDIRVKEMIEGTGQFKEMLGALATDYGDVGTGFTPKQRKKLWSTNLLGEIIEVEFMEWTPQGKLRHPRFKRVRWDKDNENLEERRSI